MGTPALGLSFRLTWTPITLLMLLGYPPILNIPGHSPGGAHHEGSVHFNAFVHRMHDHGEEQEDVRLFFGEDSLEFAV